MKRKVISLLCILLIIVGCSPKYEKLELSKDSIVVEYGQSVHFEKYLSNGGYSSFEVSGYDPFLIGTQTVSLKATYEGLVHEGKMEVDVVDTYLPIIEVRDGEELVLSVGEPFDLNKYFKSYDVVDGELNSKLVSDFSTDKPGQYELSIEAEDKNGLVAKKNFTISVVNPDATDIADVSQPEETSEPSSPTPNKPKPDVKPKPEVKPTPEVKPKPKPQPQKFPNREFLYSQGYNRGNVTEACTSYITQAQSQGMGGGCYPIYENDDKTGNVIGMEARFN